MTQPAVRFRMPWNLRGGACGVHVVGQGSCVSPALWLTVVHAEAGARVAGDEIDGVWLCTEP